MLTCMFSAGRETNFSELIARQIFMWHSNVFEDWKHCKQYQLKCFLPRSFVFFCHKSVKCNLKHILKFLQSKLVINQHSIHNFV